MLFTCYGQQARKKERTLLLKKNYFITEYPQEFFSVQCGIQDTKGKLWLGTGGNGVYIYDGHSFTNFTHKDGLRHDDILCCMQDHNGRIWMGTRNGLIIYTPSGKPAMPADFDNILIQEHLADARNSQKTPYHYKPADNFVWCIFEDSRRQIWFGTNKGLFIHDSRANTRLPVFTRMTLKGAALPDSLNDITVTGINEDSKGNIWFTSDFIKGKGLFCYNKEGLVRFTPDGLTAFRSIVKGSGDSIFFLSAYHGVYLYDGKKFNNFSHTIGITSDTILCMAATRNGQFWFGMGSDNIMGPGEGGLWHYDGKNLKHLTVDDGLSHNCVFAIIEDLRGKMWFGTRNTGLCSYDGRSFTDFTDR